MTQHSNNNQETTKLLTKRLPATDAGSAHEQLIEILTNLVRHISDIDRKIDELAQCIANPKTTRDYYTVAEFAKLTERSQYRVREWCRLERINAEKCETGRGDAKSWRIPASELSRYLDHGLLPAKYLA